MMKLRLTSRGCSKRPTQRCSYFALVALAFIHGCAPRRMLNRSVVQLSAPYKPPNMFVDVAHQQFNTSAQTGYTSFLSFERGKVTKTIKLDSPMFDGSDQAALDTIERELCILKILQQFPWCPRLLEFGPDYLTTSFVGHPLNRTNLPDDIFEQAKQITTDMHSVGVAHNDILWPHDEHVINTDPLTGKLILGKIEMMVWNGRISLLDFGWGTRYGSYATCKGVSDAVPSVVNVFDDSKVPYILREFAKDVKPGSTDFEVHLLIDWTSRYDLQHLTELLDDNLYVVAIYNRRAHTNETERLSTLKAFYGVPVADQRFQTKHVVYVLKDRTPNYGWRQTTKGTRIVNTNVFDLKMTLRKSGVQVHATDNIQETMDNMNVLQLSYSRFAARPDFSDLQDVFQALNSAVNFTYVVLRNFDSLPLEVGIDEHFDLDLLVSDYYAAKRLLGASSTTDQRNEDGKGRVQNRFKVDGKWVQVDLRYVGDDYYDATWEAVMLSNRQLLRGFYVPDNENLRYSLL